MAQRGQKRAADDDGEAAFLADLDGLFEPDEPTALVEAKKQKGRPLNRPKFHGRAVTQERVCEHEIGRHGYAKALSVGDFEKRYLSLTRVEKTPEGWIAPTESYVFQGVCPSTTAALHLDRALDIDVLLQRLPCNKRAGRPTKKAAALTPQPAEVARRSLYDGPFEALVGRGAPPLRNRMGGDGRAQLTGRSEIGRRVCTWSANGATRGKVISAARNADASITFCVLDDDGQQRELSESELGQALGMYELYEKHMANATAANEMAMAGMSL